MFILGATAVAIVAGGSALSTRANAMPVGVPAHVGIVESVALCFYIDGWNGPGMYQCGYRHRRGMGWHGPRNGGGHHVTNRGGGRPAMHKASGHSGGGHSGGGKKHH
ncbi:MAG TPA: hypothetical protein VGM66_10525 [Candidatus Udaeobacter sp.]